MDYNINFPHLHIYLDHVGKNIMIGNFSIAYYGIVIAAKVESSSFAPERISLQVCTKWAKNP